MGVGVGVGVGGKSSVADIVLAHRERLRRYAIGLCRNPNDADDLVQETLVRALQSRALPDNLAAGRWLTVTAYRLFVDQCRRRKSQDQVLRSIRAAATATPALPVPIPRWKTVSDDALQSAIERLPDRLKRPLVMRARGQSYREIAEQLGVGLNTVGSQIRRARLALRKALDAQF